MLAKTSYSTGVDPSVRLTWGVIEIQVTDLSRAVGFWTDAIGLIVRDQGDTYAELGTRKRGLVILRAGATMAAQPQYLGLYHVAIGVPDQVEFSRILARLISRKIKISPTDHLGSKSIYFTDPDQLDIEIVFETPERVGRYGTQSQGALLYDVDGQPHSGRDPLDVNAELMPAHNLDLEAPLFDAAVIAHMHFKVPELESANAWFEGIGFTGHMMMNDWGFADMSAGGKVMHRLAMNVWNGRNLSPAPDHMAGLVRYTLYAHDPEVLENARGVSASDDGFQGIDPCGVAFDLLPIS